MGHSIFAKREREWVGAVVLVAVVWVALRVEAGIRSVPGWVWWAVGAAAVSIVAGVWLLVRRHRRL